MAAVRFIRVQSSELSRGSATVTAAAGSVGSKPAKATPSYQCSYCPRVFKRSEHCNRHKLAHTNEKPYSCSFCHKSYSRKDLVKRHERTIHADQYEKPLDADQTTEKQDTHSTQHRRDGRDDSGVQRSHKFRTYSSSVDDRYIHIDPDLPARPTASAQTTESEFIANDAFQSVTNVTNTNSGLTVPPTRATSEDLHDDIPLDPALSMSTAGTALANTSTSDFPPLAFSPSQIFDYDVEPLMSPMSFSGSAHAFGAGTASSGHQQAIPQEQHRHKRQRLHSSASVQQSQKQSQLQTPSQSLNTLQLPTPATLGFHDVRPVAETVDSHLDFMNFDFGMGEVSDQFFFHHLKQQEGIHPDAAENMPEPIHLLDMSDLSDIQRTTESISSQSPDTAANKPDRARLTKILREKSENPPRLAVDEMAFARLRADAFQRYGDQNFQFPLRSLRDLQHFLSGYLDCFHRHMPILHLPSLIVSETPSPLILAVCAIGALYRLDRSKARKIFTACNQILHADPSRQTLSTNDMLSEPESSRGCALNPLWVMQTRILLLLYATLGNDTILLKAELDKVGVFMTDFKARRPSLARMQCHSAVSWEEWIAIESTKRYLGASFICSSLLVAVYDLPPGYGITQDLDFGLVEEEKLWAAPTAEAWRALCSTRTPASERTIRSVMSDMLTGKDECSDQAPYYISGFTALIIIHGINIYARSLAQLTHFSTPAFSELSGVMPTTLLSNALASFTKCHEVLNLARPEGIEAVWNEPDGPLLLNCEASLRVAYTRLFLQPIMPDSNILYNNCTEENIALLHRFVNTKQLRGPLITKVMSNMCEAFSVPAKAGYLLVQKTAAISWSIDHALAGWGCVLLLSHWLHCLDTHFSDSPPTQLENDIIEEVKAALEGMDIEYDESTSLAAAVVKSWAPLMMDVWVWGITTIMGRLLHDLAQVYEEDLVRYRAIKSKI